MENVQYYFFMPWHNYFLGVVVYLRHNSTENASIPG